MNFTPLGNRIVVRQTNAVDVTKGGILLPEHIRRPLHEGEVVAIGPDSVEVTVGDYVFLSAGKSTEIKIGNDKYLILPETDILGIME